MRKQLLVVIVLLFVAAACGSTPDETPAAPTAVPTSAPIDTAPAEPGVTVSDAVPPIEELLDVGLTTEQAECFIATIDPDGDGTVNIELFAEALACQ